MEITTADALLADRVKAIIADEMADCLLAGSVDVADPAAVVAVLAADGFGSPSIAYCMDRAIEIVRKERRAPARDRQLM